MRVCVGFVRVRVVGYDRIPPQRLEFEMKHPVTIFISSGEANCEEARTKRTEPSSRGRRLPLTAPLPWLREVL